MYTNTITRLKLSKVYTDRETNRQNLLKIYLLRMFSIDPCVYGSVIMVTCSYTRLEIGKHLDLTLEFFIVR